MDVAVFGAGSLGSLVGGLLARAHEVTLVGRNPHVDAVRESGLRVTGRESTTVRPAATTDGTGLTADLAVVTVKAYDTEVAAEELATGAFGAALSLQNGMGNERSLAERLDCPVLGGTTTLGAVLARPGVVEWRGGGEVVLGAWPDSADPGSGDAAVERGAATDERGETPSDRGQDAAERAARAFRAAGVAADVVADVRGPLWEKLAVNAAINPATALARVENGALLTAPEDLLASAARETARVARAAGVDLADDEAVAAAERVATDTARNESSMRRDVAAGERTEIDAICGHVVERADRSGVTVPVNRTLLALVRSWEAARGLR